MRNKLFQIIGETIWCSREGNDGGAGSDGPGLIQLVDGWTTLKHKSGWPI